MISVVPVANNYSLSETAKETPKIISSGPRRGTDQYPGLGRGVITLLCYRGQAKTCN